MKVYIVNIIVTDGERNSKYIDSVWSDEAEVNEYIKLWNQRHYKNAYSPYLELDQSYEVDMFEGYLNNLRKEAIDAKR